MTPIEFEIQLTQNAIDFFASQIKAWCDFLGGNDADENTQVPESTFIIGRGLGTVSTNRLNGYWTRGIFTCDFALTPASKSNYIHNISVLNGLLADENTEVVSSFLHNNLTFDASDADTFYWASGDGYLQSVPAVTVHTWNYDGSSRSVSHIKINYASFDESAGAGNFFNVPTIDYNEYFPYLLSGAPTFQNAVNKGGSLTVETINNKDFSYSYSDDYGYYFDLPDTFSYDEFKDFMNKVIDTTAPDTNISFPSYSELPFAYIEPIHKLDYDLSMPDTSDYLDVNVVSEPLSLCSDGLTYLWDVVSSLGLAPVLGFCLVATLIIRGLRGD